MRHIAHAGVKVNKLLAFSGVLSAAASAPAIMVSIESRDSRSEQRPKDAEPINGAFQIISMKVCRNKKLTEIFFSENIQTNVYFERNK